MYTGIRRSYTLLVQLLMEIIEELGTDRGIEMLQTAVERQADIIEKELKDEIPEELPPIKKGIKIYRDFMESAGAEVTLREEDDVQATFWVKRCPFYEALLDVGIDCGYFLGGLCTHLTLPAIQATMERFDPRLKLETKIVRESAEELCLERIYLEQP
jgi:predicted ArsR family transcriptional regulator